MKSWEENATICDSCTHNLVVGSLGEYPAARDSNMILSLEGENPKFGH